MKLNKKTLIEKKNQRRKEKSKALFLPLNNALWGGVQNKFWNLILNQINIKWWN